jgi:hypothetical protein
VLQGFRYRYLVEAKVGELLREAGFVDVRFERVGRVPALAKSMIGLARKP